MGVFFEPFNSLFDSFFSCFECCTEIFAICSISGSPPFRFRIPVYSRHRGIITFIASLFYGCSPSAILWAVIPSVIYAVDRMSWGRSGSHIFDEVFKAIGSSPFFAYPYSFCTVSRIRSIARLVTSFVHPLPNPVFFWEFFPWSLKRYFQFGIAVASDSLPMLRAISFCFYVGPAASSYFADFVHEIVVSHSPFWRNLRPHHRV